MFKKRRPLDVTLRWATAISLFVTLPAVAAERYWVYETTGGYLDSSPGMGDVDGDGVIDIVVTSTVGPVFALDAAGHEIWRVDLEEPIPVAPTVVDILADPVPEVLVLAETGRLACLEGRTGDIIWESNALGRNKWGAMTVAVADINRDGEMEIVAGDMDGKLACFDSSGTELWSHQEPVGIGSAPAIGDLDGDGYAEIVCVTEDTPLFCLDHKGTLRWRMMETAAGWEGRLRREASAPVIWDLDRDGTPEIIVGIGRTVSAASADGKLLWSSPMKNQVDSAISVADTDGDGEVEIFAMDLSGKIACIGGDGKEKWAASVEGRARRSPTIADIDGDGEIEILAAGYSGYGFVFDYRGKLEDKFVINGGTNAALTIADLAGDGGLCAIVPEITGDLVVHRWEPVIENPAVLWPEYRYGSTRTGSTLSPEQRKTDSGVTHIDLGDVGEKSTAFTVKLLNPERRKLTVELSCRAEGESREEVAKSIRGKRGTVKLPYKPAELTGEEVVFHCVLLDGTETLAQHQFTVNIPTFGDALDALELTVAELDGLIPLLADSGGIVERAHYLASKVADVHGPFEDLASLSPMERRALRDRLTNLNADASRLRAIVMSAAEQGGKTLVAFGANPWAAFGGVDELLENRTPSPIVKMEAFHGEIESGAVNIFNFSGEPRTVKVLVTDLTRASDKASVTGDDVFTLREVVSVPNQQAETSADALPALNQGRTIVVPPWDGRQLWLTADTAGLSPGEWSGNVSLRSLDVESQEASAVIQITVWDTPLPEKQALRFCNWTGIDVIDGALEDLVAHGTNVFTGGRPGNAEFDKSGNLVGKVDWSAHDAYMTRHNADAIVMFHSIIHLSGPAPEFSPVWKKAFKQYCGEWLEHLRSLGFGYENVAFYPTDEPGLDDGRRVEFFLKWAAATREADAQIPIYANPVGHISVEHLTQMAPYTDIWCPLQASGWYVDPDLMERMAIMRATGGQLWNYACSHDAKRFSPLGYYRSQAWMVWSLGHTGIGIYTYFRSGDANWFMPVGVGDYEMVYRGDGVVPSKRWEAVRDGVEDFSMLHLLRERAGAAKAAGKAPEAVAEATRLLTEDAAVVGGYCDWSLPGKDGVSAFRTKVDAEWQTIQEARRTMARLLATLK
jgi:outer membrane protein assembly factor BamB